MQTKQDRNNYMKAYMKQYRANLSEEKYKQYRANENRIS